MYTGIVYICAFWTVEPVLLLVLRSSLFWVSWPTSRTWTYPKWPNQVQLKKHKTVSKKIVILNHFNFWMMLNALFMNWTPCRTWLGVHRLSSSCRHDAFPSALGGLLLHYDHPAGIRQWGNLCSCHVATMNVESESVFF